jgi:hypothetical protein
MAATHIGHGSPSVDPGTSANSKESAPGSFAALHSLALRGAVRQLPEESDSLLRDGLVRSTSAGYELTESGHRRHRALFERERRSIDLGHLEMAYARLPGLTRRLRDLWVEWEANDEPPHGQMVGRLCTILDEAELILRRSAAVAPRFSSYQRRLDAARYLVLDSDLQYAFGTGVESILIVWREMTEDYLQTLGCAHDEDDL